MWGDIMSYLENIDMNYDLLVSLPIDVVESNPIDFDWKEYYDLYDDLKFKLSHNQETALKHWTKYGIKESRHYKKSYFLIENEILKFKPDAKIILTENLGMDIGGFLQVYKHIDKNTKLILKIHTKSGLGSEDKKSHYSLRVGYDEAKKHGQEWFRDLMGGVLKNKDQVKKILFEFENNNKCGMVGYRLYNNYKKNKNHIMDMFNKLKIKDLDLDNSFFIGGTIFWVDNDILKKYLTDTVISDILKMLGPGYSYEPSYSHAMERIFGYFIYNENKVIKIID